MLADLKERLEIALEDEAAHTQMSRLTYLNLGKFYVHTNPPVCLLLPQTSSNESPPSTPQWTLVTQQRPAANHRRDLLIEERPIAMASCLIWIWIWKHLPHYISHYLINYSWNPQTSKGARMSTWTALNLIHRLSFVTSKHVSPCRVHKCLVRTLHREMEEVRVGHGWQEKGLS